MKLTFRWASWWRWSFWWVRRWFCFFIWWVRCVVNVGQETHALSYFFALAGCPWVLLPTNKSKGGHCQPFFWFNNFVARSTGCGVHPKLKLLWDQILMKNEKMKKMNFIWDQGGNKGERDEMCFVTHYLFLQSKSFVGTSIFLYFGINN